MHHQTDLNTLHVICSRVNWDYQVGDQVPLRKEGTLSKTESFMNVILGLSHQFIQMGQLRCNAEQNQNN